MSASAARLFERPLVVRPILVLALLLRPLRALIAPIGDPDFWWVAAAGRDTLRTGDVPRVNGYSFIDGVHPWVMHEWLFGLVYAAGLRALGPLFFALAAVVFAFLAGALVLAGTLAACRHRTAGVALALLAFICFFERFANPRPTGVALLFPLALSLLAFAPRFGGRHAVASALLEWIWTNAHGSFPLGIGLLVVGALERTGRARAWELGAAGAGALLTLVNPYGTGLHRLVYRYARGDEGIFKVIHERFLDFAPLWRWHAGSITAARVAGIVIVAALTIAAAREARFRWRALLVGALVAMATAHVRHVEMCGLVAVVAYAPVVDSLLDRMRPALGAPLAPRLILLPACGALALVLLALLARRTRDDWIPSYPGGASFVRLAERVPDGAHLYTPSSTAGIALWYGAERGVRIVFDVRNDCYSPELAIAALDLEKDAGSALRVVERFGADHALVARASPVGRALAAPGGWRGTGDDGDWTMFERPR
jgi:hypothetical protein